MTTEKAIKTTFFLTPSAICSILWIYMGEGVR